MTGKNEPADGMRVLYFQHTKSGRMSLSYTDYVSTITAKHNGNAQRWYGIKISSRKHNHLPILLYQVIFQQLMNLDYAMLSLSEHSGFPHPNK